ncbi:hypothetical protein V1512DRAFT_263352 [Lipomyces arxii]|uniref:uncharacterized protein n=1 Tax=Lipomyces arxii TaxID=56418 RepID=UPI0034CE8156
MLSTLTPNSMRDPFSATQRRIARIKEKCTPKQSNYTAVSSKPTTAKLSHKGAKPTTASAPAKSIAKQASARNTTSLVQSHSQSTLHSEASTISSQHQWQGTSPYSHSHSSDQLSLNPSLLQLPSPETETRDSSASAAKSFFSSFATRFGPMFSSQTAISSSSLRKEEKHRAQPANKTKKSSISSSPKTKTPEPFSEFQSFQSPSNAENGVTNAGFAKNIESFSSNVEVTAIDVLQQTDGSQLPYWHCIPEYESQVQQASSYTLVDGDEMSSLSANNSPSTTRKRSYEDLVIESLTPCEPHTPIEISNPYLSFVDDFFPPHSQSFEHSDTLSHSPHGSKRLAIDFESSLVGSVPDELMQNMAVSYNPEGIYDPVPAVIIENQDRQLKPKSSDGSIAQFYGVDFLPISDTEILDQSSSPLYNNSPYIQRGSPHTMTGQESVMQNVSPVQPTTQYIYSTPAYSAFGIYTPLVQIAPNTQQVLETSPNILDAAPRDIIPITGAFRREKIAVMTAPIRAAIQESSFVNLTAEHKDVINKAVAPSGSNRRAKKKPSISN